MLEKTLRTALCLLPLLAAVPAPARAELEAWDDKVIINDPEWRKRFLGSYGFLSGAEPKVNETELIALREVIDLMKENPRAAEAVLKQQVTGDSSATLDFILANLQFQNGQLEDARKNFSSALS